MALRLFAASPCQQRVIPGEIVSQKCRSTGFPRWGTETPTPPLK